MANQRRSETVRFGTVLEALQKAMPHIPQEIVELIPDSYDLDVNDQISKEEFELLFDMKSKMKSSLGPSRSAKKLQNDMHRKDKDQDNLAILKYLAQSLDKEGITPARLFKMADKNFNQVLTVDELKEQVKAMLPNSFAGLNFKKLLKAFDLNGNGLIE